MAVPKKENFCPRCYLEDGIDEPIVYHLGSTQPLKCGKEHVYDDREELSTLTKQMLDQKRALAPKADPPPPVIEVASSDPPKIDGDITNPLPTAGIKGLVITPIDMVRLTSILGTFTDSSSLFGAVFAIQSQLKDTEELLKRAQSARAVSSAGSGPGPRVVGGDAIIQLVIPERHVEPIKDIAEANGMDITRYMNAKVEDGLDNLWYYAAIISLGGSLLWQLVLGAGSILV